MCSFDATCPYGNRFRLKAATAKEEEAMAPPGGVGRPGSEASKVSSSSSCPLPRAVKAPMLIKHPPPLNPNPEIQPPEPLEPAPANELCTHTHTQALEITIMHERTYTNHACTPSGPRVYQMEHLELRRSYSYHMNESKMPILNGFALWLNSTLQMLSTLLVITPRLIVSLVLPPTSTTAATSKQHPTRRHHSRISGDEANIRTPFGRE